jgi:branched-chain amino acid transport system permease protein
MNGLISGLIIALIALGLSLIFGVMGIVNMAHGDFYMFGAVGAFYAVTAMGGSFWLTLLIVPLLIAIMSAPIERFILRPYEGNPSLTMIATVGISFMLQTTSLALYGGIPKQISNPWPVNFDILGISYPGYRILVALISILVLSLIWFFLYKTSYGILIRASMQDKDTANALGINVNSVLILTFALGAALAALGGVLASPIYQVSYLMGNDVILLCFIVVIIGGLGSLEGTLLAALGISALEGVLAHFLNPTNAKAAIFILMVIVLLLKPQGLLGDPDR